MSEAQVAKLKSLEELVRVQQGIIDCLEADIRSREFTKAWTTAARTDPVARERLSKLAEDETADVDLPEGWIFHGLRAVRRADVVEAQGEIEQDSPPEPERTAMHDTLDGLLGVRT